MEISGLHTLAPIEAEILLHRGSAQKIGAYSGNSSLKKKPLKLLHFVGLFQPRNTLNIFLLFLNLPHELRRHQTPFRKQSPAQGSEMDRMGLYLRYPAVFKELLYRNQKLQRPCGPLSGLVAPQGFLHPDEENFPAECRRRRKSIGGKCCGRNCRRSDSRARRYGCSLPRRNFRSARRSHRLKMT